MIINTGGRTDSVQYYSKWLLKRFEEGYVLSRNPLFPNKVSRYLLTPEKVDGVVFCSKNYAPILNDLHRISDRFHTYFHYTITAYGKDVEPGVPSITESMDDVPAKFRTVENSRINGDSGCWIPRCFRQRAASQRKIILDTGFIILFRYFILYTKYYTRNSLPCTGD